MLATGSSIGHIALWDLNNGGRLLHIIRGAHDGAITSVEWVPGQPLLISSGEDNSVKVCTSILRYNVNLRILKGQYSNGSSTLRPPLLDY